MTIPRRRVIRPPASSRAVPPRLLKVRAKLDRECRSVQRWLLGLKRSFHRFEKYQLRVSRLEREIHSLEYS
jgi:hypothetical protein